MSAERNHSSRSGMKPATSPGAAAGKMAEPAAGVRVGNGPKNLASPSGGAQSSPKKKAPPKRPRLKKIHAGWHLFQMHTSFVNRYLALQQVRWGFARLSHLVGEALRVYEEHTLEEFGLTIEQVLAMSSEERRDFADRRRDLDLTLGSFRAQQTHHRN
jgi:hypothetical protein